MPDRPPGSWSRRLHAVGWGAIAVLGLAVAVRLCLVADVARQNVYLKVFAPAADAWLHGRDLYAVEGGFRYPPIAALLFVPFAWCGDRLGSVLWRAVLWLVLVAGVRAVFRADWPRPLAAGERGAFLLVVTVAAIGSLNNGQPNLLILGAAMLATTGLLRGRVIAPGGWSALAIAFKVYPAAHGLLLAALRPRLLLALVPAIALALLLPFSLQHSDYVRAQYGALVELLAHEDRTGDAADAYRDLRLLAAAAGIALPPLLFHLLQVVGGGAIALVCLLLQRRGTALAFVLDHALGLVSCWYMLLGPATEKVTYVLLAPTVAWSWLLARRCPRRWPRAFWTGVALLFVLDHLVPGPARAVQAEHPWTRCALPLAALLAALALAGRALRQLRRPAVEAVSRCG